MRQISPFTTVLQLHLAFIVWLGTSRLRLNTSHAPQATAADNRASRTLFIGYTSTQSTLHRLFLARSDSPMQRLQPSMEPNPGFMHTQDLHTILRAMVITASTRGQFQPTSKIGPHTIFTILYPNYPILLYWRITTKGSHRFGPSVYTVLGSTALQG